MIKYIPYLTSVVLEEIPGKLSLAVEITNCQGKCPGCHSPFLREDIGSELDESAIDAMLEDNFGVNCFLFLGEGKDPERLMALASYVRSKGLLVALYSGREAVEDEFWEVFDYIKLGPYISEKGPLNSTTTNQRLYKVTASGREDITKLFWHRGIMDKK